MKPIAVSVARCTIGVNDLQSTTAYWIIALWHHPPYSKGSHDSDSATELKQMRKIFFRFLKIMELILLYRVTVILMKGPTSFTGIMDCPRLSTR
jgi:hypothetical protein